MQAHMLHAKQGVGTAQSFKSQVKETDQKLEYTHSLTQGFKKSIVQN